MSKDPVCGMPVTTDKENRCRHEEVDYYFCCTSCHDKFVADPQKYRSPAAALTPGACPKCGMALESLTVEVEEDTTELDYMRKRLWVCTLLAFPVFVSAMASEMWPPRRLRN